MIECKKNSVKGIKMQKPKLLSVLTILFYLLAAFNLSGAHAAPDSFKLCPANSEALMYFDIKTFRAFAEKNNIASQFKDQIEKIKNLASIDILKDINSFTAVLTNIANYKAGKNPEGAFIFEGYFKISEIESKMTAGGLKSETLENIKMFKLDEDVYLAMPSEKFLVYGNLSEIKSINSLIAAKEKNNVENDEFFKREINAAEVNGKNFALTVKLPAALSDLATSIAKINKEQAVFSGLEGFVAAASGSDLLFKYIYKTKDDAARGAVSAKEFMDNGFKQISYNAKRMTEGVIDKAKVASERFNFIKSGLVLMLKLQQTMKIEQKEKSVFISFELAKAEKETGDFVNSIFEAFIATLVKSDAKTPAPVTGN